MSSTTMKTINPSPADAVLEEQATALYRVLTDLIRVYQARDRDRICCHDLTISQCHALEALVRDGPMTVNDLAGHLYLDKSTTSRIINALDRKRLTRREPNPDDRRSLLLAASSTGERRVKAILASIVQQEKHLLAEFDAEVRSALLELIGRLARSAASRVTVTGGVCCCLG